MKQILYAASHKQPRPSYHAAILNKQDLGNEGVK
jgi:hypothetical protein